MPTLPSLALVGPGRAGRALARSWLAAGGTLASVVARSPEGAREAVENLGSGAPATLAHDLYDRTVPDRTVPDRTIRGEVLVLAVPDDAISDTAGRISESAEARVAFHLSGALPAEAIASLRAGGRSVGSLHPLRAFSGRPTETFDGVLVAVEGDPAACDAALQFLAALGARGRRIEREAKALYHAGATLAAGGAVALVSSACRLWELAGIPEVDARPALAELAARATEAAGSGSFAEALTGPVARRDVATVRAHVAALSAEPDLLRLYAALARETLVRTPGRGREDELRALLARNP